MNLKELNWLIRFFDVTENRRVRLRAPGSDRLFTIVGLEPGVTDERLVLLIAPEEDSDGSGGD